MKFALNGCGRIVSVFIIDQGRSFLDKFAVKLQDNCKVPYLRTISNRITFDDFCLSDQFEIINISSVIPFKRI